jgi:hypothetical protein
VTVLHYDADYDRIAEVTGQPVQWIVPGSAEKESEDSDKPADREGAEAELDAQ